MNTSPFMEPTTTTFSDFSKSWGLALLYMTCFTMGIKEEAIGEAFNLGSAKEHRVIDMANMVNDLAGNKAGIIYAERRNWDVKCKLLSSVDKAKRVLGYQPKMAFEDGLKNVHQWFSENWDSVKKTAEF